MLVLLVLSIPRGWRGAMAGWLSGRHVAMSSIGCVLLIVFFCFCVCWYCVVRGGSLAEYRIHIVIILTILVVATVISTLIVINLL